MTVPLFAEESKVKNVIIFLVDDMGWRDLGVTGSDLYETPNIDRLAQSGVLFSQAYSACTVCSPTRAAMLTGKSPARLHITDWISGFPAVNTTLNIPEWTKVLLHEEVTLAEMLKPHGYQTAHIGKWHLCKRENSPKGTHRPYIADTDFYPQSQGFDINVAGNENGAPPSYFWPYGRGKTLELQKDNSIYDTLPNESPDRNREGEYLTDRLTDEAISVLGEFDKKDEPFFLYFAYYNVHTPIQARPDLLKKYQAKLAGRDMSQQIHKDAAYAAMVESVDESVGRIIAELEKLGQSDETMIIFTSDNGGLDLSYRAITENAPLRQGKGSVYEGGVRVPAIVSIPGNPRNGKVSSTPVITMDYVPTVLETLGFNAPDGLEKQFDGVSLAPLLAAPEKEGALAERDLFFHYPHYHTQGGFPHTAIRSGDYKYYDFHDDSHPELYHLGEDIGENRNLTRVDPKKATELQKKIEAWRAKVGAQMPTINPDFDPSKPSGKPGRFLAPQRD